MKLEEASETMWKALEQGDHFPEALRGRLSMDEAHAVQLEMLARRVAGGEKQVGWKVGLTSDTVRAVFGVDAPVFGYLLESGAHAGGKAFPFDSLTVPCIESELCFTMGKALRGPGVTREQALDAVASVAPSFEILERRVDATADFALAVADNVMQIGFATAEAVSPYPRELELGALVAEVTTDGALFKKLVGAEAIDDQLETVAWLANKLAQFGQGLQPGMRIMSGSFYPPTPVAKGQRWETTFSGVGEITVSFP